MMKITLVTVTYNAESVLRRTLESVFAQRYSGIEHIIIDGASTDNTVAMAKDYMERSFASDNGHEVRLLVEPDNGIYDAMNKGLDMATGDYVCFLNAGDSLPDETTVQKVVDCANANSRIESEGRVVLPAVVYGNTDIVDAEGNFLSHRHLSSPDNLSWRSFRFGMLVCHQAFYARLDIAKNIKYNMKYRYSADFDWCIRVMKKAEELRLVLADSGAVLADYLKEGTTTKHHKASLKERFDIMAEYYGTLSTCLRHVWFAVRSVVRR